MQQRLEGAAEGGKRKGRNFQCQLEAVARGIQKAAVEILTVGKGYGVDQDVQVAPVVFDQGGSVGDLAVVAHVTLEGKFTAQVLTEGLHPFFNGLAHIVEGQARALFLKGGGDAVGDASVVGKAHDQGFFSLQQHGFSSLL